MLDVDAHELQDRNGRYSYFRHSLIETIDRLDRSRIGERQHIRPQAHNIAVLPVQVDVCPLGFPASDVKVPPPIGVSCQRVSRVFIQTIVELIPSQTQHHTNYEDDRPVGSEEREQLAGQHVEVLLALGGVENTR
jgi:hypothetical protein